MGWFRTLRINRAAKEYARKLPKRLRDGWGVSLHYTPGQIKRAVKDLGLDTRFIAIGYAAFLPEDDFNRIRPDMPVPMTYHEARTAFIAHEPVDLGSRHTSMDPYDGSGAPYVGGDGHGP